jgi:hypothetical protein
MPAGQSALWKYKAIYRQGDDRVGQWSDVVSLPVAGRGRAALLRSPNYFRAGAVASKQSGDGQHRPTVNQHQRI